MKTAIFSVVYPGVEAFFKNFLDSLQNQSNKNFSLYLSNDNLMNINDIVSGYDLNITIRKAKGSPVSIRKKGVNWLNDEGIDLIVFADADDYFSDNRVELCKQYLKTYDIVVNELILFGEKLPKEIPLLSSRYQEGTLIREQDILSKNFLGFSNTAIRIDKLPSKVFKIPEKTIAFDWAFYGLFLHSGAKSIFTNKIKTYYRQHNNNIASLTSIQDNDILRAVKVKRDHYSFLSIYNKEYEKYSNQYKKLHDSMKNKPSIKREYCDSIKQNYKFPSLWWEMASYPEGIEL